jgi:hypothetical protein
LSPAAAVALAIVFGALGVTAFGPTVSGRIREMRSRRTASAARRRARASWDPGRELRAERTARDLMRSVVGADDYAMYQELGFLRVVGRDGNGRPDGYGYLIYPHRPIVSYDTASGEPLSEYCVEFPDRLETAYGERLPDADDALAKWMSLHGDERKLIADANMHSVGRQIDPDHIRRDLKRLRAWESRTATVT